jgi:hypothetical protein
MEVTRKSIRSARVPAVCNREIMGIDVINPLSDDRWDDLVTHHPRASVFHQRGWLEALSRTCGYEPLAHERACGPTVKGWHCFVPRL